MNTQRRELLKGLVATGVILGCSGWIWRTQFAPPPIQDRLHEGIGVRLAQETAGRLEGKGEIVVVSLSPGANPVVDHQRRMFSAALKQWPGVRVVREDFVDPEKGSKYGPGAGMSARRYLRLAEKHPAVGAIVSFIGFPDGADLPTTNAPSKHPRLIGVSRSHKKLGPLLRQGVIDTALVPRFVFPAPGPEHPRTAAEWFENRFQVVVTPGTTR